MGAKDLYLLQIVLYKANDHEKEPSQWVFFVHDTDKQGNPTGEGETHGIEHTRNGLKYVQRHAKFLSAGFAGACTLGLFYKKNVYRILEELESGRLESRKLKKALGIAAGVDLGREEVYIPRMWLEDRLQALRRAGVVVLGPPLQELVQKAYHGWRAHTEDTKQTPSKSSLVDTPHPASPSSSEGQSSLPVGDIIKQYYCYPFVQYASTL